jgi:hypothetical protein
MEIFITFPSLSAMEILGNGVFISLRVDFALLIGKKIIWIFFPFPFNNENLRKWAFYIFEG